MKARIIIILCMAILSGTQYAPAQSLQEKIRTATNKIGNQVKQNVTSRTHDNTDNKSHHDTGQKKQNNYKTVSYNNKNAEDQAPTVKLPKTHTALFAPLGYPVDAKYGIKSAKPVVPPTSADAQVNWSEKLPNVYELDNQSLVEEYVMLDKYVADGYIKPLTPAYWRYSDLVKAEIFDRTQALNDFVEKYNEALMEYEMEDTPNWVINDIHNRIAGILDSRAYKTLLRSSIAPLFSLKDNFLEEETKEYFKNHGGYENATKVTLTVWDPKPNKESVSTSTSGQSGTVLNENESGATIDIGGVIYVLHRKNGKPLKAFISKVVKTAVAGKDIEIPDNVIYKGENYPVREMRGEIFFGTTIKSVKLPSTLREISNKAFRGTPITEITIPASVKIIQGSAFYECKKLTKVVFESDEMEELHGCFQNCTSLKSIKLPRKVGLMSYEMFSGCTSLTDVTLPENMTEIYPKMFEGCINLKNVDIPSSVVKVGNGAFTNSGITSLDLSNVREFEDFCFDNCKALKTVKLNSALKDNFLMETYQVFIGCPLLEVKYINNNYVIPDGFIFVDGK